MQPVLKNLIDQHLKSPEDLPPDVSSFLEALQQVGVGTDTGPDIETILESMPFGITLIDKQKNIQYANESAVKLMGYDSLEGIVGHLCHDTLCPADKDKCPILDMGQQVDRSDRVLITKDKSRVPILKSVTPIMYKGEEVLLEAFIDITEQKKMEQIREQAFQARGELANHTNTIIKRLAEEKNEAGVVQTATQMIQKLFGFYRVQWFDFNPVANNLKIVEAAGPDAKIPTAQRAILPQAVGTAGRAAFERTVQLANEKDLANNNLSDLVGERTRSQVCLPVFAQDELIAVLDVQAEREETTTQDTILFLETLSIQLGVILAGIKAMNDLADQFEELNELQMKSSVEGWLQFAESSTINTRYIFDPEENAAVPYLRDENEGHSESEVIANALQVRGSVIGSIGVSDEADQPLTEEEKQLIESISSEVAEALERARLFESSQRSASELAVLNEMGATFAQADTEEFINSTIFDYTTKLMKAPQFFIATFTPEEGLVSFPYVVLDGERVTPDHPDADQWLPRPTGTGLTGYMIQHRLPILIDSEAEATLEKLGLPYQQFGGGTQSFLGVPMILGDRAIGVISVQSETDRNLYTRHHLDLLTTIASQAAVSINNTRLFQQEQERAQQERTVRTITDRVRRGGDTHEIMQIALEELSLALDADLSTIQLGDPKSILETNQDHLSPSDDPQPQEVE